MAFSSRIRSISFRGHRKRHLQRHSSVRLLSPLLALAFVACASIPMATAAQDAEAKKFSPVAEKGVLYVVHNGGYLSSRALLQIFVDGRAMGSLTGWTFHRLVLDHGMHSVLASSPENEQQVDVDVAAGDVRFVGVTSAWGWAHGRVGDLRRLTTEEGRADVSKAQLAVGFGR
ncbi:MAG: hypothetical protein R3F29_04700 [Planctomycetota bacterium]